MQQAVGVARQEGAQAQWQQWSQGVQAQLQQLQAGHARELAGHQAAAEQQLAAAMQVGAVRLQLQVHTSLQPELACRSQSRVSGGALLRRRHGLQTLHCSPLFLCVWASVALLCSARSAATLQEARACEQALQAEIEQLASQLQAAGAHLEVQARQAQEHSAQLQASAAASALHSVKRTAGMMQLFVLYSR